MNFAEREKAETLFTGLLRLRKELEPWEEAVCRKRVPLMVEIMERVDGGEPFDNMRDVYEEMKKPVGDGTQSVPFRPQHMGWILEMAMRERIFDSEEELRVAMTDTAEYYGDGEPFSMLRWMSMASDLAVSKKLGEAGRLS